MNWELIVDTIAKKQLKRLPKKDMERIVSAIEELQKDPYVGDVEKMKGERYAWRRRIGSYRVLYELYISRRIVYVTEVERRTSTTY